MKVMCFSQSATIISQARHTASQEIQEYSCHPMESRLPKRGMRGGSNNSARRNFSNGVGSLQPSQQFSSQCRQWNSLRICGPSSMRPKRRRPPWRFALTPIQTSIAMMSARQSPSSRNATDSLACYLCSAQTNRWKISRQETYSNEDLDHAYSWTPANTVIVVSRYLTVDYHLADLLQRSYSSDREASLRRALQQYERFLTRLDDYELLNDSNKKHYERYAENPSTFSLTPVNDAASRREVKITRFKEEKELKQRLEVG